MQRAIIITIDILGSAVLFGAVSIINGQGKRKFFWMLFFGCLFSLHILNIFTNLSYDYVLELECQSDQECTQPTPFCVQSTCVGKNG